MSDSSSSPRPHRSRSRTASVVVAVIAALVTLALLLTPALVGLSADQDAAPRPTTSAQPEGEPPPEMVAIERREDGDPLALGEVGAPVVLVNYSDFQCPYCAQWARETKPALMEYVEDGDLRIEWRDFPYIGQESVTLAVAGRAAAQQGAFWPFHDAMYADLAAGREDRATQRRLVGIARRLGLDVEQFRSTLSDQTLLGAVRADFDQGQSIGVNATPAFLVNGNPILGAQPTQEFVDAIEQALAAAP